jgi:hypothetical protein
MPEGAHCGMLIAWFDDDEVKIHVSGPGHREGNDLRDVLGGQRSQPSVNAIRFLGTAPETYQRELGFYHSRSDLHESHRLPEVLGA